jgi:predicted enzyme related to lactoylglutathione lyase
MTMKKVTGIGGLFFKTKDPIKLREWYRDNLGFQTTDWGSSMMWTDKQGKICRTEWSPFKEDTKYFDPSKLPYMINYRVSDIKQLIETLRNDGVTIVGGVDDTEYGKFAWIMDPEGRKIELYEPMEDSDPPPLWTGKVIGLNAIFFKSDDPAKMKQWYKKHLDVDDIVMPVNNDDKLFSDTTKPFIFGYQVRNPESKSVIIDPDGNKVILSQS